MPTYETPDYRWPTNGESIRVGATKPPLRAYLIDKTGAPIDVSDGGITVTFSSWNLDSNTISVDTQSCTKANGYVEYQWQTADTATAGDYRGRLRVVWSDGRVQFAPTGRFVVYRVRADDGS